MENVRQRIDFLEKEVQRFKYMLAIDPANFDLLDQYESMLAELKDLKG